MASYDIEYRVDDMDNDTECTDRTTKKGLAKQLKEIKTEYGDRVIDITINKWDEEWDELIDQWNYPSIDEAIAEHKKGLPSQY